MYEVLVCPIRPDSPDTRDVVPSQFSVASPGYKKYRHIGTCSFGPAVSSRDTVGRGKLQTARMETQGVSFTHFT